MSGRPYRRPHIRTSTRAFFEERIPADDAAALQTHSSHRGLELQCISFMKKRDAGVCARAMAKNCATACSLGDFPVRLAHGCGTRRRVRGALAGPPRAVAPRPCGDATPSPATHAIFTPLKTRGIFRNAFSGQGCLPGAPRSGRWFFLGLSFHIDC